MHATKTFLLSALLAFPVAEASRLVCDNATLGIAERVQINYEEADLVLLGKVTASKITLINYEEFFEAPRSEDDTAPPTSMAQLLDSLQPSDRNVGQKTFQSANIAVIKLWKGHSLDSISVVNYSRPGLYGFNLRKGESYLIFSHKLDDGSYTASTVCAATTPAEMAEEQIKILDNLKEQTEILN